MQETIYMERISKYYEGFFKGLDTKTSLNVK